MLEQEIQFSPSVYLIAALRKLIWIEIKQNTILKKIDTTKRDPYYLPYFIIIYTKFDFILWVFSITITRK